jgi:glutaredoxin 2
MKNKVLSLYVYDHCPFCVRARMIFGLKNIEYNLKFLLNEDEETPIKMIGQKMVPILKREDNSYMSESLDIVYYVDTKYSPQLIIHKGKYNNQLYQWLDNSGFYVARLAMPRWPRANFEEFKTQESINYFRNKKEAYMGSFQDHLNKTQEYIAALEPLLDALDKLLYSVKYASADHLTEDDIILFPRLRSLSIVKGINFPNKVITYMQNMSKASNVNLNLDIAI